jgi:hypothetical protein
MTDDEYYSWSHKEKPDAIDRLRADKLLQKLTYSQFEELWSWKDNAELSLRKIKNGEVQFEVIPHRELNMIANYFHYHWNGKNYV